MTTQDDRTLRWDPAVLPEDWRGFLVGPGAPFELVEEEVLGVPTPVFASRLPSMRAVLERAADQYADAVYLAFPDAAHTYAAFGGAVAALARRLQDEFGVTKGDRVAMASANSPGHALGWWASVSTGALAVGLNGWWSPAELRHGVELTRPTVLLADARRRERLVEAGVDVPVLDIDEVGAAALAAGAGIADLPPVELDEDDPAVIMFTSGTTGRPKGAVLSHRNFVHVGLSAGLGAAINAAHNPNPSPPSTDQPASLCVTPFFHVSGSLPLAMAAVFGSRMVFPPAGPWDEATHLRLTAEHRVSGWSGVPTQFWRLLEHPDFDRYDLTCLRNLGGGGAVFAPELLRLMREKLPGVTIGTGYGMTETLGSGTRLGGPLVDSHPDSVGKVEPGCAVQVRGDDGTVLGEDEVGEVCIRGASVFLGYWDDPGATEAALDEHRWYRTGDFGRIRDGVLYLESRMRDLIIRGGENIYPIEIENRLVEHPDVVEASVVGLDHQVLGQEVVAVVVPRPGSGLTGQAVQAWVGEALAGFKVPAHVVFRDALPYTETGKVVKHQLEDELRVELSARG